MKTIELNSIDPIKTQLVTACQNFEELERVIRECEPFVSNSRDVPVYWWAEKLIERIHSVRKGWMVNLVTRANGIREKMVELLQSEEIK